MDFPHRIVFFLTLVLTMPPLTAESGQAALDLCLTRAHQGDTDCRVHPCPCYENEIVIQAFDADGSTAPLCACSSQRQARLSNRQLAVAACDEHRRDQRRPCFISRNDCPRGFEAIAIYGDNPGTRFIACRDQRHERPTGDPGQGIDLRSLRAEELIDHYNRIVDLMKDQSSGEPRALPKSTLERLQPFFPGYDLKQVTLVPTAALAKGCFTDCDKIFCAEDGTVDQWSGDSATINRLLLHQIVHSQNCERLGGRERFALHWFQQLPDEVFEKLRAGHPVSADRIHYAMYLESHADGMADGICRSLPGCQAD